MANTQKLMAVVNHILAAKGEMSAARLQKLVFYCQAYSLAWDGVPLFDNRIEAWIFGPVIPDLYNSHEDYTDVKLDFFKTFPAAQLSENEIDSIDAVLDGIGDRTGQWLSDLSHTEDPWIDARKGLDENVNGTNLISHESMKSYYSQVE
ncbi:MAG: DUF4065 domain-containing protein [Candidatus Pacebacteria bacterium]|nr:DUF4065 domain-containing protein [Candidatus Paceibacterota bacterium]